MLGQLVPPVPNAAALNAQVAPLVGSGMNPSLSVWSLAAPIPDITSTPTSLVPDWSQCDWWQRLNGEIELHPFISVGILVLVFGALHGGAHAVKARRARRKK